MISHQLYVENIKCEGCVNSIKSNLLKVRGVTQVEVYKEEEKVCVSGIAIDRQEMADRLSAIGYPEKGNNSMGSKVKSLVSCAIGKVS
ncbi:MAG: heavy-metal-associated domain-containing protein [Bacteroidetes bacterium]|nr:heavy-metal-associated domain-containing protein [Bacteroidota bacterium]